MEGIPTYGQAVANLPGQTNYVGALNQDVQNLAPLATTYHSATPAAQYSNFTGSSSSSLSNLQKFTNFFGSLGSQIGHLAGAAAHFVGNSLVSAVEAPIHYGAGEAHGFLDRQTLGANNTQFQQLSARYDTLNNEFKSGMISASSYKQQLFEYNQDMNNLLKQTTALDARLGGDYNQTKNGLIGTSTDLLTILTGGFGKAAQVDVSASGLTAKDALTATDAIKGSLGNTYLSVAERTIQDVASDSKLFAKLDQAAQTAVQRASAEVVATGETMTSGDIARASAANLALKYPLTFAFVNPAASDFYNQLDQGHYAQAVKSLGYTFGIVAAGGAIPYALKYGGGALAGVSARTFAKTQFWDELGKYYSENSPRAFYDAVNTVLGSLAPAEKETALKNLASLEATNMHAVGGDAIAAARRVSEGQTVAYGYSTKDMTAAEEVKRMIGFTEAQREADRLGKIDGKVYTAVRADARNINRISAALSSSTSPEEYLQNWENWKAVNAQLAEANNSSLDKQIKSFAHLDPTSRDQAIRDIQASTIVKGTKKLKTSFGEEYYVAEPKTVAAPFREGTGEIKSRFAQQGDLWTKAVKPVPVLSHVAGALTTLGLSPDSSIHRVYQYFNDYLGKNLQEGGLREFKNMQGEELQQSTDTLIKQASSYMYDKNRSGLMNKTPINDLRQMTIQDWMKATGKSRAEAQAIQEAVAKAHLQVPLAIKGMGEKAVDAIYSTKPTGFITRRYMRLQAALRFTVNPFFQYLRVIPKNEILTETHGGGYIRSIWNGRLKQLNAARQQLRDAGYFASQDGVASTGFTETGEATDFSGATAIGRPKKLLPMQEKSIAGMVDSLAQKEGLTTQQYIDAHPTDIKDLIDGIVGYSSKSNFLNSPLARTLNIAIFPFRFEAKVAGAMAKSLASSGLLTRVMFINGLAKAHDFFTSPEGQAWYRQNAELIGLIKYVTPIGTMNEVFHSLLPGHDHSIGNFGELGGLPFGWIPQLLDAEGLTHFNAPGVNPKTGDVYKQYIPATQRGQLATALQDLLSGLFSYPGATVGLPSKTSLTLAAAKGLTGAKSADFQAVTPNAPGSTAATPTGTAGIPQYQQVAQSYSVPASTPATPPILPKDSRATRSAKKKKGQFTPALLPGQTSLGQLP